jgi:hypothetical protein
MHDMGEVLVRIEGGDGLVVTFAGEQYHVYCAPNEELIKLMSAKGKIGHEIGLGEGWDA